MGGIFLKSSRNPIHGWKKWSSVQAGCPKLVVLWSLRDCSLGQYILPRRDISSLLTSANPARQA
jgi:hypothetical protein